MLNATVPAAATGLPISRDDLERMIEEAIAILDVIDGDPDLEPPLGSYDASRYEPDAEGDLADDEPSLAGTNDIDQTNWSQGASDDSEVNELGSMARATYSLLGEAQATREASARLGAIIARLSGVPAGSRQDIMTTGSRLDTHTTGSDRALSLEGCSRTDIDTPEARKLRPNGAAPKSGARNLDDPNLNRSTLRNFAPFKIKALTGKRMDIHTLQDRVDISTVGSHGPILGAGSAVRA